MFVITNTIVMIKLQSTIFMPTERGKRPHVDLSNLETNENITFSGFSVGFCINEEKVISYQPELEK